jgi:hypothetical protein
MNGTLARALVASVVVGLMSYRSLSSLFREKSGASAVQFLGAGCLTVVVAAHICEALHLFPWVGWGSPHSTGHYLDLWSAVAGLTLLTIGYVLRRFTNRRAE